MRLRLTISSIVAGLFSIFNATGAVLYVDVNSTSPLPPYAALSTAATNIQDAIDAASSGDEVRVNDGVYNAGSRADENSVANRIAVTKPITVRSVNGPAVTIIDGSGAVRCAYLTNGTALTGFTLTNGSVSGDGGGVWCESTNAVLSNCVLTGNSAANLAGGILNGTLYNCTVSNNNGFIGGGSASSTLSNCVVTGNEALEGGGAAGGTLIRCTLTGNFARDSGGGANGALLTNCWLSSNLASGVGGGVGGCPAVYNCIIVSNNAGNGGGASGSELYNCSLTGNAAYTGGGSFGGGLNNCTLIGNTAQLEGGGFDNGFLTNCIIYYNHAPSSANYIQGEGPSGLDYCCTTPMPPTGSNNITNEPAMADLEHLSAGSPCRGAGSAAITSGVDIDGEPWANPPSIGCDEFYAGVITGPLSPAIQSDYTNVTPGFPINFTCQVTGHAALNVWNFGDGNTVSNQIQVTHVWPVTGNYTVTFTVYNDSNPGGVSATVLIHVGPDIHYVDLNNTNPIAPFTSWATAATNLQDGVDAVVAPGGQVFVKDGVYMIGGRTVGAQTNRVVVSKFTHVQSLNGPAVTLIQGYQEPGTTNGYDTVRCVYLSDSASLVGFTLTRGATRPDAQDWIPDNEKSGGGVWCETANCIVSNCVFTGNSAAGGGGGMSGGILLNSTLGTNAASGGGGAAGSQVTNCLFINNYATSQGGGAAGCVMSNCTFSGNLAVGSGGGAAYGTLDHCVLTNNAVSNPPQYWSTSGGGAFGATLNNCLLVTNSASGGGGAEQCALNDSVLTNNQALWGGGADNSQLTNCTVSGNSAQSGAGSFQSTLDHCPVTGNYGQYGGGAQYCLLMSCVVATNTTYDGDEGLGMGGGADSSTLTNCLVWGNVSSTSAGLSASTVVNCTIVSNITTQPGASVDGCTVYNSIVYYNTQPGGTNCSNSSLMNCCTPPAADLGFGTITNEPLFVNLTAGNYRLQYTSPCINSGANLYNAVTNDLDENPRVTGGTVDIGAYEFQAPVSLISYAWLLQHGMPADGSADFLDPDHDGMNNFQEWRAGTDPMNATSKLLMMSVSNGDGGLDVTWKSVDGVTYYLQRACKLGGPSSFTSIQSNLVGQAGSTTITDTTATNGNLFFYRVGVQ